MGTGSNPGSSASDPAPCLWPGKAVENGPKLETLHPCGKQEEVSGSWLRISITPAIGLTCGVSHQTDYLPLCLSSSLYISDIPINKFLKN